MEFYDKNDYMQYSEEKKAALNSALVLMPSNYNSSKPITKQVEIRENGETVKYNVTLGRAGDGNWGWIIFAVLKVK